MRINARGASAEDTDPEGLYLVFRLLWCGLASRSGRGFEPVAALAETDRTSFVVCGALEAATVAVILYVPGYSERSQLLDAVLDEIIL